MPPLEKVELTEATQRAPFLVSEESPLEAFVRAEHFDAQAAARRLAGYWKTRKQVFGPKRYLKSMSLDGQVSAMMPHDLDVTLRRHYMKLLPPDKTGRPVFYFDRTGVDSSETDRASLVRCLFYMFQALALQDPDSEQYQSRGCVIVISFR